MVRLSVLILLAFFSANSHSEATAHLDRSSIAENETVTLTVTVNESGMRTSPQTQTLKKNFDILNTQQATRSQWINGQSTTSTEWRYILAPKEAGVITIPALTVGNYRTNALTLQVKAAANSQTTNTDPIFIELHHDKNALYVGEQLLLTLQINYAIQVSNLELSPPDIDRARVEQLDEVRFERSINNNHYITHEIVYAVYPQAEGVIRIDPVTVTALVPRTRSDALLRRGEPRRFSSNAAEITVKPAQTTGQWLPAADITLSEQWSQDPTSLQVGDSITRTIVTQAKGLMAEQLPEVTLAEQPGINLYRDRPRLDNDKNPAGVIGQRTDSVAMVATRPGKITLPALTIDWWNTKTGQMEQARLPAVTLNIKATSLAETEAAPTKHDGISVTETDGLKPHTATASSDTLWLWQLATFISSALAFFLAWQLLAKQQKPDEYDEYEASKTEQILRVLKKACAQQQPQAIRKYLLQWARLQYPQHDIHAMADIARVHPHAELAKWLNTLDACLYNEGNNSEHDWLAFYHLLMQIAAAANLSQTGLYPTR